ncbi:MAG: TetR/AcrR family transcriptional regulator [Vicinamibacterales bacterium]
MVQKSNSRSMAAAGVASARVRQRHDARRDGILRAAARMFRERGYAETGMRDIAVAADLSPANLYHYFRGKDEILFYCQDRALDRMLAGVAAARRAGEGAAARLEHVLREHLLTMLDEVEGATAHLQVESLPPPLRAPIVAKRDRYERAVRRLVADGLAGGAFAGDDPATIARAMLGALNWTVTWYRPDGAQPAAAVAAQMSRYLVRGIQGPQMPQMPQMAQMELKEPGQPGRRLRLVSGRAPKRNRR